MYQVEAILDKKLDSNTNKQLYLIKWKGYNQVHSSWQPLQHLNNCQELLDKFQNEYGSMKTTTIGKVFIREVKSDDKSSSNIKPECKSNKTIKIKKQPKFQIKNQYQQRFSKQSMQEIPNKIEQTPKKIIRQEPSQKNSQSAIPPPLNLNKEGSAKRKNSVAQLGSLHRRSSLDPQSLKNSNFNIVRKNSVNPKQMQQGLNSHMKRQKQRQHNQNQPKQFTPIVLSSSQNPPARITRKNSCSKQLKQLLQQTKHNQKPKLPPNPIIIQQWTPQIDIIGMKKDKNNNYQFYIQIHGQRKWLPHQFVFENYSKQLCRFYESNLSLF